MNAYLLFLCIWDKEWPLLFNLLFFLIFASTLCIRWILWFGIRYAASAARREIFDVNALRGKQHQLVSPILQDVFIGRLKLSSLCPPTISAVHRPTWFPDILGNSSYPIFTKFGMQVYWVNSLYGIAFGDDSSIANWVIATLLLLSISLVSRHFNECY